MMTWSENVWKFVVQVYDRESVAEKCLHLQDQHGVNVSLLLFSLWVSRDYGCLNDQQARACVSLAQTFEQAVVGQLRSVRRWMKEAKQLRSATGFSDLYQDIKQQEIAAERVLLLELGRLLTPSQSDVADSQALWETIANNQRQLFPRVDAPDSLAPEIAAVTRLVFPDLTESDSTRLESVLVRHFAN